MLILFTLSIVANPPNYASAQQGAGDGEGDNAVNVEKIIEILEKAKNYVNKTFEGLRERGVTIPDTAKENFDRGLIRAEDAIQALNEDRAEDAEEDTIAAMNDFKEAMRQLGGANMTASTPAPIGIAQAINRTRIFIERLETIIGKARETGYKTAEIEKRIERTNAILDNATKLLEEGKINETAKKLGEARRAVAGLTGKLNVITKAEKNKKIKEFAEKALERLTETEQKAEELLPPQAAERVKVAIERAKEHIAQTNNLVEEERLDHAVDELEDMLKDAKEGSNELKRGVPGIVQRLNATVSIIANRLSTLQQRIETLGDVEGVVGIKKTLTEARELLKEALKDLESGELRSASKTLKHLDKTIKDINDLIREITKKTDERRGAGDRGAERRGRR